MPGFLMSSAEAGTVIAFAEFLDHFFIERGNVLWFAAGDEAVIDHHFAIDPIGAGVAEIGF